MKNIVGIGFDIPSDDEDYIRIDSNESLSDYDLVIFCPNLYNTYYDYEVGGYEGKMLYNKSSSSKIIEHTEHWKKELLSYLQSGKTLFVVLKQKEDFFIHTGSKGFSGTGKNQRTINYVQPHSNYYYLPFQFDFINASGKNAYPVNALVSSFYNDFKNYISYEAYINQDDRTERLFTTKNKDKTLGAYIKQSGGILVFLPWINFNVKSLTTENPETGLQDWNKNGIKLGERFIASLVSIDSALRKNEIKTPKPDWADDEEFNLEESQKTLSLINRNKHKINELEKENVKLTDLFFEQESLKDLLFETGKPLEMAVTNALKILGYEAENYDDGLLELDQVILSPEGERYIGECEGKDNKDIDIGKFRQLMDSLNEDFEKENIDEKAYGLLFGNPQRLTAPQNRNIGFTTKCLNGAAREKIGLIKTPDLFKVCKLLLENKNEEFKKQCRTEIKRQLGSVIIFPEMK